MTCVFVCGNRTNHFQLILMWKTRILNCSHSLNRTHSHKHVHFTDKVAIKVVDRGRLDSRALRMLSREVATLECVHHPNILRYRNAMDKFEN